MQRIETALKVGDVVARSEPGGRANIVPGAAMAWHVVVTAPQAEQIACKRLSKQGFGIYLPLFDRKVTSRDGQRQSLRQRPIFPSYLFLCGWDMRAHWGMVTSTPGVVTILCDGEERPAIVADRIIEAIQAYEFSKWQYVHLPRPRFTRRSPLPERAEIANVSTKSYWGALADLAGEARIDLLHQALGLAS